MKQRSDALDRLFNAARTATWDEPEEMPGYLQTRILARWLAGVAAGDSGQIVAAMFRRALITAGVVMLVSVAWSYGELMHDPVNDVAIANYEWRANLMP